MNPDHALRDWYEHGTWSAYSNRGCRCEACCEVARVYQRELRRRLRDRGIGSGDRRHGTLTGYRLYGCRCEPCRGANRVRVLGEYARREAARVAAGGAPRRRLIRGPMTEGDPRHGTLNGYTHLRCRCQHCIAAYRAWTGHRAPTYPRWFYLGAYPETFEPWADEWDDPTADTALANL